MGNNLQISEENINKAKVQFKISIEKIENNVLAISNDMSLVDYEGIGRDVLIKKLSEITEYIKFNKDKIDNY